MAEFTAAEYKAYVQKYPDLVAAKPAGMSDADWGKVHWEAHGEKNASRSTPGVAAGNDADTSNKPDASGYTSREYQDYVQAYPDLVKAKPAGMTDAEWGKQHWDEYGSKNPARLTPTRSKTSTWWERTTAGPSGTGVALAGLSGYSDDQYLNYVLANPDLRELSEALGLTQSETIKMGQQHWGTFGTDVGGTGENRAIGILSAVDHIRDNSDFSAGSQAASEAYIQRITQNAPGSQMWDARTNISPDWRLNQFTGAGWNMAADQPYQTGILGDTIEVNPDIGQLVPTTAAGNVGDPRFLQDRYVDASIASDFPVGWTTPENTWAAAAPGQLGAFWDVLTNAYRTPEGILRRAEDYDPFTAVGPSVSPGPRGGGNVRGGPGTGGAGTISTTGPPNPTVPSFGYPQYQDWTRFMPTNFQLAEGGGMHYQPGAWGNIPVTGGGAGNNILGTGTTTGGTAATGGPGSINPNIWGGTDTTGGGNTVTDASGNKWVMSPGGQWIPAGSDYGTALAAGNARDPNFYDSSGAFMGAEGAGVRSDQIYDSPDPATRKAVGWGGGRYTDLEIAMGIANPDVTRYDQWGNPVSMGSRKVGLNILGPTMFSNNYRVKPEWTAGLNSLQIGAMGAANAAAAGTGYANMFSGGDPANVTGFDDVGIDPTAAGFIDWDE